MYEDKIGSCISRWRNAYNLEIDSYNHSIEFGFSVSFRLNPEQCVRFISHDKSEIDAINVKAWMMAREKLGPISAISQLKWAINGNHLFLNGSTLVIDCFLFLIFGPQVQ